MVGLNSDGLNLDPDCEMFKGGDPGWNSVSELSRAWVPGSFAAIGVASVACHNFINKRPVSSGLHKYAINAVVGFAIGLWVRQYRDRFLAEKDLQYYHYMTLHPEDFQPKERVKYKNYLTNWVPIR